MASDHVRVRQLQEAMAEQDVDAMVLRLGENVVLATGWYVQIPGQGIAVVPREGSATLLIPEYEQEEAAGIWDGDVRAYPVIRHDGPNPAAALAGHLRDLAGEHGAAGGRIGYEGSFETLAPSSIHGEPNAVGLPTQNLIRETFGARELVDVTETLEAIRSVKTDHEVDLIRRTNEIAVFGLEAFKEHAVPGRTEVEIMAAVEHAVTTRGHGHRGARCVRAFCTIYSGPDLVEGWKYWRSRTRKVERDDIVMLEMGTVADGYWADHTRTVVAGKADGRLREAYGAMRGAADAAFAAATPGVTGGTVDRVSREACAAAGFEQFPHHTGHGTGFRYHESRPGIVPNSEDVLQRGNVIVTEPGIYSAELRGGVRQEDNAVVTDAGAVVLATTDYDFEL